MNATNDHDAAAKPQPARGDPATLEGRLDETQRRVLKMVLGPEEDVPNAKPAKKSASAHTKIATTAEQSNETLAEEDALVAQASRSSAVDSKISGPARSPGPEATTTGTHTEDEYGVPGAYAVGGRWGALANNDTSEVVQQDRQNTAATEPMASIETTPVARPITETDENIDLQRAEPHRPRNPKLCRATSSAWLSFGFFVLVAVLVLIVLFATRTSEEDADAELSSSIPETLVPSEAPTSLEKQVVALLPDYSLDALADQSNPQSRALEWMMGDPFLLDYPSWRIRQRFALATLYFATGGPDYWFNDTNWLSFDEHECDWFMTQTPWMCFNPLVESNCTELDFATNPCGPDFDSSSADPVTQGQYKLLSLYNHGLRGYIPPEIGLLADLRRISMEYNEITGTLPDTVASLSKLEVLHLGGNRLELRVPTFLFTMPKLDEIFLQRNSHTGLLPTEIGLFNGTMALISANQLTGTIPSQLAMASNLRFLYLQRNQLTGPIPHEVGQMESLVQLYVMANELSGTIPTTVGGLASLRELALFVNDITGPIPSELAQIDQLHTLHLSSTLVSSTIPTEIYTLTALEVLKVRNARLSGSIATEVGLLSNLQSLILSSNELSSTLPTELGQLSSLLELGFASCSLSGSIPSELGNLSLLETLNLANNVLTGSIPLTLEQMASTSTVDVTVNPFLSGVVPELLCGVETLMFDCTSTSMLCGCNCSCTGMNDSSS